MHFKDFIREERERRVVFAFGRMNPPTTGHKKLVDAVKQEAKSQGAHHEIVLSHSQDPKKNPLTPQQKLTHAQRFFPKTNISTASKEHPTLLHHLSRLHAAGHQHLTMVAGSDRTGEYEKLISKYNGKKGPHGYFNFKSHKVVSSGERDPDSEGVEGMSASKMRKHAEENNFNGFRQGVPHHVSDTHARELFDHVRKGMSMKESRDLRERYIECELYNLGETVYTKDSKSGEIVYRGSTYVTLEHQDGTTSKHWIQDLSEKMVRPVIDVATPMVKKKSPRLPVLFMNKKQISEMASAPKQVSYLGYTTQHFDMCHDAKVHIESLIAKGDRNPKFLLQAIQALDQMFGIEKDAKSAGFAHPETIHQFTMKLGIAHDTLKLLGATEQDMLYFKEHIKVMQGLSLHKDDTFANEYGTHIGAPGGVEEGVDSSDYKLVKVQTPDGRTMNKKIRAQRIITDDEEESDEMPKKQIKKPTQEKKESGAPGWSWDMKESKKTLSSFRRELEDRGVLEDVERDINSSPDKEIYDGIDKTIEDQGYPDKPLGMVSFKHFDQAKKGLGGEDNQPPEHKDTDVKRELAQASPAYAQMRKAHKQDL